MDQQGTTYRGLVGLSASGSNCAKWTDVEAASKFSDSEYYGNHSLRAALKNLTSSCREFVTRWVVGGLPITLGTGFLGSIGN